MSYSKKMAEFERRNLKIFKLFSEGKTMSEIAEMERISVPRVHQIIDRERRRERRDELSQARS